MALSNLTREEICWLAGIIEGEGTISSLGIGRIQISVGSTDLDILDKIYSLIGGSVTYVPLDSREYATIKAKKDFWTWYLTRTETCLALLYMLFPFMGSRRKSQITRVISNWIEIGPVPRNKYKTHGTRACYVHGRCRCVLCSKANSDYAYKMRTGISR